MVFQHTRTQSRTRVSVEDAVFLFDIVLTRERGEKFVNEENTVVTNVYTKIKRTNELNNLSHPCGRYGAVEHRVKHRLREFAREGRVILE